MKKGISLVALVITIIVLIVLTSTIMIMFNQGGMIGKAEEATFKSDFSNVLDSFMLYKNELMLERLGNVNDIKVDSEEKIKEYIPLLANNNKVINDHKYTDLIQIYDSKIYQSDDIAKSSTEKDKEISRWLSEIGIDVLDISILPPIPPDKIISKEENYVGYYADIDGDRTIDGIIYVDLLYGETGMFGEGWYAQRVGSFSYSSVSNSSIKSYYISQENYVGDFGTADVISPIGSGVDRFYVMALSDVSNDNYNYFNFYNNAFYEETLYNEEEDQYYYEDYGLMYDYATTTSVNFGAGKTNTINMINKWKNKDYGEQSENDIWGAIETQVSNGWFVPSREEWAAFANNLSIDKSNYSSKGLSINYWSSSQSDIMRAWAIYFSNEYINNPVVSDYRSVRLSTTF